MKKLFFLVFFVIAIAVKTLFGQSEKESFRLSAIDISSGKGAVTSGLYGNFTFEKGDKDFLILTLSEKDLEITYFRSLFKGKLLIGPNVGYFFNVPYVSTMAIYSPSKYFSTLHWLGWSFGRPSEIIELKPSFIFALNSASINIWKINTTYCLIHYLKNKPQHTVTLKYTEKITKNILVYTEVGYDLTNKTQLLKLGTRYKL